MRSWHCTRAANRDFRWQPRRTRCERARFRRRPTTFDGIDLYDTISRKAAALGHSLISNHPFVDGNKRVGHAAMEVVLLLNGYEIVAAVDDQEETVVGVASGTMSREDFVSWVEQHVVELSDGAT